MQHICTEATKTKCWAEHRVEDANGSVSHWPRVDVAGFETSISAREIWQHFVTKIGTITLVYLKFLYFKSYTTASSQNWGTTLY